MTVNRGRICLECQHCHVSPGDFGYSEYTPSSPFSFSCMKGQGFGDAFNDLNYHDGSKGALLADLRKAETCQHFTLEVRK